MKWREASSVLYDKRIPIRLKVRFYKAVFTSAMIYESECWVMNGKMQQKMSVVEIRILRWMSGVAREDQIRNKSMRQYRSDFNSGQTA